MYIVTADISAIYCLEIAKVDSAVVTPAPPVHRRVTGGSHQVQGGLQPLLDGV